MKTGTRLALITEAMYNCYDMVMAEAVKSGIDDEKQKQLFDIAQNMLFLRNKLREIDGGVKA